MYSKSLDFDIPVHMCYSFHSFQTKAMDKLVFWNSGKKGELFMKTALIYENAKYFLKYFTKIYDKETREMQVQNHLNFLPLTVVCCCKPFQVVKLYVQEQIVDTGRYVLLLKWLCSITCFPRNNKYTHRYPFLFSLIFPSSLFDFI